MSDLDVETLKCAAEELAWLVDRGYSGDAATTFVAEQRQLDAHARSILAASGRAQAHYKHHIARELEADDVARRSLCIDVASVLATINAAAEGRLLLESLAGVWCDPAWKRGDWPSAAVVGASFDALATAVQAARAKTVLWVLDPEPPNDLMDRMAALKLGKRTTVDVSHVPDAGAALAGAANVASSDPAVLDGCVTWFNLARVAAEPFAPAPLQL